MIEVKERLFCRISETIIIKIHNHHWGGNMQLSMKGISVEYFPNTINPRSK